MLASFEKRKCCSCLTENLDVFCFYSIHKNEPIHVCWACLRHANQIIDILSNKEDIKTKFREHTHSTAMGETSMAIKKGK